MYACMKVCILNKQLQASGKNLNANFIQKNYCLTLKVYNLSVKSFYSAFLSSIVPADLFRIRSTCFGNYFSMKKIPCSHSPLHSSWLSHIVENALQ